MSFFVVIVSFLFLSIILIALSSLQLHIKNVEYNFDLKRRKFK